MMLKTTRHFDIKRYNIVNILKDEKNLLEGRSLNLTSNWKNNIRKIAVLRAS